MASFNIKRYVKKIWKDHLVEYPDRRFITPVENASADTIELKREGAEGDIYQEGDPILAEYLNNIEEGIEGNNIGILKMSDTTKATQLKLLILEAALLGDIKGGMLMENFEDISNLTIERGIYDQGEKLIYCYDSKGNRIELNGLGAAIA